ncbi:hypothetical protein PZA11_001021 [Diplocarpon coronariae]|uniref:DUF1168 domain protein n=1 Tax=Diplocarpon coronariae TaxID=2795749 RepID=A0A218ZHV5_9HELO|nr:hypothetical protein JHW43_002341 [Diplocarpon mali]OWP07354.1 hypothetical protein B2J93_6133 [Marssonina coronariae]
MSEQIPESIPTSADPRSKRPLKKRALSPRSQTASAISTLFSKPSQEIYVPSSTSLATKIPHGGPPEIVQNVQGSSAGAGSGEFHVYKASRRREYERLKGMDEEVRREEEGEKWDREKREREERDREKTRKNRQKRDRLKKKKAGKEVGDETEGTGKGGKVKARIINGKGVEGPSGEGNCNDEELGQMVVEEKGVIIHDDD